MRHGKCGQRLRAGLVLAMALSGVVAIQGATPRWITGPPYFTVSNTPVIWYIDQPRYYTDPGDLSASVNHAAADAMVAAAANVWNVPTARVVLSQGGALNEEVSGANVYPDANGLVFPADVDSANYAAKQIAVIYDRNGSVTDLLLGSGASDPSGCRQSAVTESVDAVTPAGFIQHAVLILNGRCTGPAAEQQLQMQYQLERAFGRLLGVGWSQLNDNVFTGTPQPTYAQALHWPVMHPIDVICGPYAYQCLPQPFTLRDDDIASISTLYPVKSGSVLPGKQVTLAHAVTQDGMIYFPTSEGMAGVNVVIRRNPVPLQVVETFDDVSAVTGSLQQQVGGTPIAAKPTDLEGSLGSMTGVGSQQFFFTHDTAGYFYFGYIPLSPGVALQDQFFRTEAINPLYTGAYTVGPYPLSSVAPSGSPVMWRTNGVVPGYYNFAFEPAADAATACGTGSDGTESAPAAAAAGGWSTGIICGTTNPNPLSYAHTSWTSLPVRDKRSLALEVTALDEAGLTTVNKMRPVIGVWNATDPVGTPPSVTSAGAAFNSLVLGMTSTAVQNTGTNTLRIALTDERGDGRPDYRYQSRILYADTISPSTGTAGTQVTVTGMGFRAGNTLKINGVMAKVTSWTATTIVANVPFLGTFALGTTQTLDVTVSDLSTQGSTVMGGAFQYVYSAPVYTMQVISAPAGNVPVGLAASPPLVVRMIDMDGITPLAGASVIFSATSGAVTWSACGLPVCTVVTDTHGLASVSVTPTTLGPITLQAAALGATQMVAFNAVALVRTAAVTPAVEYLAAGATVSWTVVADFVQQGQPAIGTPVAWSVGSGPLSISDPQLATDATGGAQATATAGPLGAGLQAGGSACAWSTVCGEFMAQGVDPSEFTVLLNGGAMQFMGASGNFGPTSITIVDAAGNPVAGAPVEIHQTVSQWTAPCVGTGRCPLAPVYQVSSTTVRSDSNGIVSVVPLQITGPEVTDIVVASGTQGFLSFTLQKQP